MDFVSQIIEKIDQDVFIKTNHELERGILNDLLVLEQPLNKREHELSTEIYICIGHSSNTSFSNDIIANQNTTFIIADTCGYLYGAYLSLIAIVCSALFIKYNFSRDIINIINVISQKLNEGKVKFAKQIKPKENTLLLDISDPNNSTNILVFQSGLIKITANTDLKPVTILTPIYKNNNKSIGITRTQLSNIYPPQETILPPQDLIEYAFNNANEIKPGYRDFNNFKGILEQEIRRNEIGKLSYIDMYLSNMSSSQKYIIEVNCRVLPNNIYTTLNDQPDIKYSDTLQHMRNDESPVKLARQNSLLINQSNIQNLQDCTWQFNHVKNGWECFKIIDGIKQIFALSSNPNTDTIYEVKQNDRKQNIITKQINGKNYDIKINRVVNFDTILNQNTNDDDGHFMIEVYNSDSDRRTHWVCLIHGTESSRKECLKKNEEIQDLSISLPPPKTSDTNNDWIQVYSKRYNAYYWFNQSTGEKVWPNTVGGYSVNMKKMSVKKIKKKRHQIRKKQTKNKSKQNKSKKRGRKYK